jgi:hypothetical protein
MEFYMKESTWKTMKGDRRAMLEFVLRNVTVRWTGGWKELAQVVFSVGG